MINLLPSEQKEKLLLEKKKRLMTALLALVFYFLFCLIFILFSIKAYAKIQLEIQEATLLMTEKGLGESEIKNFQEEINETNLTLAKIDSFYQQQICFSEILEKISEILPQEIYLTNFSGAFYTKSRVLSAEKAKAKDKQETGIKFSLSGFALTREALIELKKNLEKEQDFKEIYFPPTNWVKPADIDFSLSFKVND